MRAVVQRVSRASVEVDGENVARIGPGMVVLLGIGAEDTEEDASYLAQKCVHLRIFDDEDGIMNRSLADMGGEILLISQFTLLGDARKGRRPSYANAMVPDAARELFAVAAGLFRELCPKTKTGVFQADMDVSLVNSGPVTILLDSKRQF